MSTTEDVAVEITDTLQRVARAAKREALEALRAKVQARYDEARAEHSRLWQECHASGEDGWPDYEEAAMDTHGHWLAEIDDALAALT